MAIHCAKPCKKLPADLNERIEALIVGHPEGVAIDELHAMQAEVD